MHKKTKLADEISTMVRDFSVSNEINSGTAGAKAYRGLWLLAVVCFCFIVTLTVFVVNKNSLDFNIFSVGQLSYEKRKYGVGEFYGFFNEDYESKWSLISMPDFQYVRQIIDKDHEPARLTVPHCENDACEQYAIIETAENSITIVKFAYDKGEIIYVLVGDHRLAHSFTEDISSLRDIFTITE